MKSLSQYIEEEFATPMDTMGMDNPMMPSLPEVPGELSQDFGSGDIPDANNKKRRKKKHFYQD